MWQTELLWSVADFLWSCLVVAPLVVIYWRGTWDLLEELVSLVLQENLVYIYFFLGNSYSFTQPILAEAALWVDLLHFRNADQDYIGYYKVSYWRVS